MEQKVDLFDQHGRALGPWDAWAGPMQADAYEARFVRNLNYRMHQRAAPLLGRLIVPPEGYRWLTSEREVLAAWLAVIAGMLEDIGPLGRIVEEADRLSTAAGLTGGIARQTPAARVRSAPLSHSTPPAIPPLIRPCAMASAMMVAVRKPVMQ